jgi:hypothetical protein
MRKLFGRLFVDWLSVPKLFEYLHQLSPPKLSMRLASAPIGTGDQGAWHRVLTFPDLRFGSAG